MATSNKAAELKAKKSMSSSVGAPSQRSQSTRKGKRAWRKNIDIDEVEAGLEELRTEERVTGSTLQKKTNDELFVIDVKGDDQVRKSLPKFSTSLLSSAKILAQRSAVPALQSRTTSSSLKRKTLTHEEKDRLLRMGKRVRKGPFNAVIDPTEVGAGSAMLEMSEAVKSSGQYDMWNRNGSEEITPEWETISSKPKKVKAPTLPNPRSFIEVSAVPSPHEGTSYNPPVSAHQDLLRTAHEIEERRVKEAEEMAKTKEKMEKARRVAVAEDVLGFAPGMTVQEVEGDDTIVDGTEEVMPTKKIPERKTKQERRKAEKLRAEKRALAEKLANKRLLASVNAAKSLRKAVGKTSAARERLRSEQQEKVMQEKLKKGLAGQRLGKHLVPEGNVDVQLGDDLSESLRALKPEGNLFKDRFLSMQHRALVEPRVPVIPRRGNKLKEYEKHAWKRFDREQ
ncbi:hypothetical protein PHLCEN_2v1735 [Hermanssonia centrifuga]|uniref:Ribosome biogenesis protein NOP53 n=1 Tax=Hermanssonia centrifuga TaxID=98765 RepID=A0A2R6RW52_9APHY|nr:hypothetical protein PHLCEN_2v1735 [Hermanssonia centrifuga]